MIATIPRTLEVWLIIPSSGSHFRHPRPYRLAQSRPPLPWNLHQITIDTPLHPSSIHLTFLQLQAHTCLNLRLAVTRVRSAICQCRADTLSPGQTSTRLRLWNHLELPRVLTQTATSGISNSSTAASQMLPCHGQRKLVLQSRSEEVVMGAGKPFLLFSSPPTLPSLSPSGSLQQLTKV